MTDQTTTPAAKAEEQTSWLGELRNLAFLLFIVFCIHSFLGKPFYIPSASMMPGLLKGDRLIVSKYPYGWSFASISFHLAPEFSGRLFGNLPKRGDIAIVEPIGVRTDYIKRVIGLPGDRIEVREGRLILNGRPIKSEILPERQLPYDANEDCTGGTVRMASDGKPACFVQVVRETFPDGTWFDTMDAGISMADTFGPITVPEGHVFLMGDNRDNSSDSRFPSGAPENGLGGAVPFENVGGRAEFITFSLDGTSVWYNPISWFTAMRPGRAGTSLRPSMGVPPREDASVNQAGPIVAPTR